MRIKLDINIKVGRVVKYLVLSDLVFYAGWGMILPIFAVFVVAEIPGATIVDVGIAAALYWTIKSVLQVPIAKYLDRTPGEKDDFYALILGLIIASVSAFLFVLVSEIWQLYAIQVLHASGFALYFASRPAIFARHLDQDKISFDWALDNSAIGISAGIAGFLGALVASAFGFKAVFVLVALLSLAAAMVLLLAPDLILPKAKKEADVPSQIKDRPPTPIGH